eukprot:39575_1
MSGEASETTETNGTELAQTALDDYEPEHEPAQPTKPATKAPKTSDDLAAMRKRVADIEAEAAKISAMSAVDEDVTTNSSSLPPSSGAQSLEPSNDKSSKASSVDASNQKTSEQKEDVTKPTKEGGAEEWPETIEEQQALDSRSVFIKNVDHNTDANELKAHFESCGTIERITIVCDKWTGKPKGCAYIQFKSLESVAAACLLNDKEFNGRIIKVMEKRTNLPPWLRNKGRGGRGRGRGRGRGYRRGGWGGYGGYRGRGGWGGYGGGYSGGWYPY